MKWNRYTVIVLFLIIFSLWHLSIRSFWNGSIKDSIGVGPNVLALAQKHDPTFAIKRPYDGQFFYALALDPLFLTDDTLSSIDVPSYRAKRILYPFLAWVFSAGQPRLVPPVLFFLNMISWFLIGFAGFKIAQKDGHPTGWLVVALMTITGVTFSVMRTMAEPLALAFLLAGCFFWKENKWKMAVLFFGFAGLTREDTLIVPLVIGIVSLLERRRHHRPLFLLAASFVPFLLWWIYLSWRLPSHTYQYGERISWPGYGMIKEVMFFLTQHPTRTEMLRTLSVVVIAAGIIISSVFLIWRYPTFWGVLTITEALFCSVLQGDIWNHYAGSIRVLIPLMAFFIIWMSEIGFQYRSGKTSAELSASS